MTQSCREVPFLQNDGRRERTATLSSFPQLGCLFPGEGNVGKMSEDTKEGPVLPDGCQSS